MIIVTFSDGNSIRLFFVSSELDKAEQQTNIETDYESSLHFLF